MPQADWLIMLGLGVLFLSLGIGAYFWGRIEESAYYDSMPTRRADVREYLERWPFRPEPGALKIGGWILMAIGLILLLTGGAIWLWG
ncbi:MAG: hypothetical protein HYX84_03095 [Chloroflexi bacterium]|nr:hypothetical protein [Chloroflexota bacterium]